MLRGGIQAPKAVRLMGPVRMRSAPIEANRFPPAMIQGNGLPHRRRNPLTDEWVLCSPQRATRPWQGQREVSNAVGRPRHDPNCYLCARNVRASKKKNPDYAGTFVFENDFPALLNEEGASSSLEPVLLESQPVKGTCRVICYSPRHDLSLAQMDIAAIEGVIRTWVEQAGELGRRYSWVQVFENKGSVMGCSNPHPHGQIWAMDQIPTLPAKEDFCQHKYLSRNGRPLLADYCRLEIERSERVVCLNEDWLVVVPYWATWPFETLLLPRSPISRLSELALDKVGLLAEMLKEIMVKYDNLFETEFPYSMGWHGAPNGVEPADHWQLHAHFFPPLLRSATVKKFMVGFEMLADAQRDVTPEAAATRLRELPPVRFDDTSL